MTVDGLYIPCISNFLRPPLTPPIIDAALLGQPITLPCGITIPNRLVKVCLSHDQPKPHNFNVRLNISQTSPN